MNIMWLCVNNAKSAIFVTLGRCKDTFKRFSSTLVFFFLGGGGGERRVFAFILNFYNL